MCVHAKMKIIGEIINLMGKKLAGNGVVIFALFSETSMPKIYSLLNPIPTRHLGMPKN